MSEPEYRVAALWMSGHLSYLEQLCLVSYRDAGHHITLYTYGDVPNIPEGIEHADAASIIPDKGFLKHERTGSPALHSDLFRYHLLAKNDKLIWVDTDAYCVKPFKTANGHFYGWESEKHVNGGVLGLPRDSETLRALLEFTSDEFAIPEWYGEAYTNELTAARDSGSPIHVGEQPWGVWGPHAITHFLAKTGEIRFALPQIALYPFTFKDRALMLKRGIELGKYMNDETYSVHFYGRRMRKRLVEKEGGIPKKASLIGQLLDKHRIDPRQAPLPQ